MDTNITRLILGKSFMPQRHEIHTSCKHGRWREVINGFDKRWQDDWVRASLKQHVLLGVTSMQRLVSTESHGWKCTWWTCDWLIDVHVDVHTICWEMFAGYTLHHSLLRVGLCSYRLISYDVKLKTGAEEESDLTNHIFFHIVWTSDVCASYQRFFATVQK